MKVSRSLKRWWYQNIAASLPGKFRVLYNDGQMSHPVDYVAAKYMAKMFDGEIVDNF